MLSLRLLSRPFLCSLFCESLFFASFSHIDRASLHAGWSGIDFSARATKLGLFSLLDRALCSGRDDCTLHALTLLGQLAKSNESVRAKLAGEKQLLIRLTDMLGESLGLGFPHLCAFSMRFGTVNPPLSSFPMSHALGQLAKSNESVRAKLAG